MSKHFYVGISGKIGAIIFAATVVMACAGSGARPMSTSLGDLVAETNSTTAGLFTYQEIVSVAGNLPIPQVGPLLVYPPAKLSPSHMLGISDSIADRSFYLLGTSEPSKTDTDDGRKLVQAIAKRLGNIQDSVAESIRLTVAAGVIAAQLQNETIEPLQVAALEQERLDLLSRRTDNDKEINKLQTELRDLASVPGIVIARWSAASQAGGGIKAGSFLNSDASVQRGQSGYLVMNGYRVALLFFGRDFEYYVRCMHEDDFDAFGNTAIATYLLQSRQVAYTSSLDIESIFSFYTEFDPNSAKAALRSIDRLSIAGYAAKLASFSNMGSFDNLIWSKKELLYSEISTSSKNGRYVPIENDFDGSDVTGYIRLRPIPLFEDSENNPTDLNGWHTVQAVMTTAPRFFKFLRKKECLREP